MTRVAYMALALCNAQGELHPLEVGIHALKSGLDITAYAERAGAVRTTLQDKVKAARVYETVTDIRHEAMNRWQHLSVIHAAPRWLWRALVAAMLGKGWTVEQTRDAVAARVEAELELLVGQAGQGVERAPRGGERHMCRVKQPNVATNCEKPLNHAPRPLQFVADHPRELRDVARFRMRGDLDVMLEGQNLPPAGGFQGFRDSGSIHAHLERRPVPVLALDGAEAVAGGRGGSDGAGAGSCRTGTGEPH
jgi:hypothetical protein